MKNEQMNRTLQFLMSIQESDGSFYETEAKLTHSPQRWLQENTLIDQIYFTAAAPMRLNSLSYHDHPLLEPALQWLESHWSDWGSVTGTWYCVGFAVQSCCSDTGGIVRPLLQKSTGIPHLTPLALTWFLDALDGAHFPRDDPLLVNSIEHLSTVQNEEGAFPDPFAPVEVTVTALRLLRIYE